MAEYFPATGNFRDHTTIMDVEIMDEGELIDDLIRKEVCELQGDINQVKEVISDEIEKRMNNLQQVEDETGDDDYAEVSLSAIDDAYIDQKYIQYCSEFWLVEVERFLSDQKNLGLDIVQDLLNSVDTMKNLSQIPQPLNQLQYYTLLMTNSDLIGRYKEQTFLKKFKSTCSEKIVDYLGFVQSELDFLKAVLDFLLASKDIRGIIADLNLAGFCAGNLPFNNLINKILNLRIGAYEMELIPLQEAANCLKAEEQPFLSKLLRNIIGVYIKPVEIRETTLDGRSVIEATGKSIVMSRILDELETKVLENSDIEELRVVGAYVLHIDVDLKNEIWHGKNVFILSKKIKIYDKVIWNVSGKKSDHIYMGNTGAGRDGHGKQGKDGYAGESGGNVSIVADEIKNAGNLTIISNGGEGSRGQDGGDGSDGASGKGIRKDKFEETLPSVVTFLPNQSKRENLLETTVVNIKRTSSTLKTDWSVDAHKFIEAMTREGNEITFSYCAATWMDKCLQAFLLCKGSLGEPGGRGGEYGLGGEGGFNGEINTNNPNIVVQSNKGKSGENGNGGFFGSHGKNGWDMGYTDYPAWPNAEFYGSDECSKLQLTYHTTSWGSAPKYSVWCPYHISYAEITATGIDHKKEKKYQEQTNTRQSDVLQHQAQATKKKSILMGKTLVDYSHCYSSVERNTMQNTQLNIDNIMQRALQAMVENSEQQENVTTELRVKHVKSSRQNKNIHHNKTTAVTPSLNTPEDTTKLDIGSLIRLLTSDVELDDRFNAVKNTEHDRYELNQLFSHVALKNKNTAQNTETKKIQLLLIEKYRFAMLREIANHLPDHPNVTNPVQVTPEIASRYLIVAKEDEDKISHKILGTLNQYLYENDRQQREKVRKFFNEELLRNSADKEPLQRSVESFVLKAVTSEKVHPVVEKYYIEFKEFPEKKHKSLNIFLEALINGLEKHADIFSLWIEHNKSHSMKVRLVRELRKPEHEVLNAIYNRYNNTLKKTYDWSKCCEDKVFLKEYSDHILERGPLSASYRELLAHVFNVNIRSYIEHHENQFCLLDNHKPASERTLHILLGDRALKQLEIDLNYLRLEKERAKIGHTYAKVLSDTKTFIKKQEIDEYFEKEILSTEYVKENYIQNPHETDEEDDESVYELCTEKLESEDNKDDADSERSIRAFILEVGDSEDVHPDVKKYYIEFEEFSEKQEKSLNTFFEPFYSELRRYKHVLALWIAQNNNEYKKRDLEKEIRKHDFLNILYNRFDNQLKLEYDWSQCCRNEHVLKEYDEYISDNGSLPESFTDLSPQVMDKDNWLEEEYRNLDELHTYHSENIESSKLIEESDHFLETQSLYLDSNISDDEYHVREEQDIIEIMKYLSLPEERMQIKERLAKITSQYTGHRGILHYLSSRFSSDGMHVSFWELCYLVNSILTSVIQERKEMNIFCWIIAACPQKSWIDELFLLHLENYFKAPLPDKRKFKAYLSKLKRKDILLSMALKLDRHESNTSITVECIEEALELLSYVPNEKISLERLDLREWPYALKEGYWAVELSELTECTECSEDLSEASYYLLSMENTFGIPLVEKFMTIMKETVKKSRRVASERFTVILSNFYNERWNLSEAELKILSECDIIEWERRMKQKFTVEQKERDVTLLIQLIEGNGNTSDTIFSKLAEVRHSLQSIRRQGRATNTQLAIAVGELLGRARKTVVQWFTRRADVSEGASNSLLAIENPVTSVQNQNRDANRQSSETNFGMLFTDDKPSIESIRNEVLGITEDIASTMNESDFEIYLKMFRTCLNSFPAEKLSDKREFMEKARIGMLAVIDRGIELRRKFNLRDTQKITILALLMNERKILAQVSTGEGKSLIVVAASIMKALCREKVDIITSSSVLAKRDAQVNRDIYSLFGISVSHNCNEVIEERRAAYSSSQVVYGDLSNFQRDFLLDRFYEKNVLGDRNFENVFVDEVDSMLLDRGNNMLYLSHDLEGFDKLESIYIYIWQWISRPAEAIRAAILYDLYGLITKEDIKQLDSGLGEQRAALILERLIEAEIFDDQGKMLRENIEDDELGRILLPCKLNKYKSRLSYLLKECTRRKKSIHVPNYLKPFIEEHLDAWINSAKTAAAMQEDHNYVIDVDRTGTSRDLNPHITIVDRDTGTDQANSQWDEGLHQFLQLKHGCKLSLQSLKAVFISNVTYLKLYKNLYGVTGTLGSVRERDLLLKIHEVDFITIPTSKPKQFYEEMPIFCDNKEKWVETIFNEAEQFAKIKAQSILIICETINDAETLHRAFLRRGVIKDNLHKYTRDYKVFDIAQGEKKLKPGQIIIATNLSGRGTDIKIEDELRNAGGLHVCLTYLPKNSRIEQQAFGRGARGGDKGSGRLIIMGSTSEECCDNEILDSKPEGYGAEKLDHTSDTKQYNNLKILDLKKHRDAEELHRISDIKEYYETQIVTEEKYYNTFQAQYKKLSKTLSNKKVCADVKKILMQCCLDKWAFWLDRNNKLMENSTDDEEDRVNFEESLEEFISELDNLRNENIKIWVQELPFQMIKLGKYFCQDGKYDDAIQLFNQVIELEPSFSEAAHYYKAFALVNTIDWKKKPVDNEVLQELKTELWEAARLFDQHSKSSTYAETAVEAVKQNDKNSIIQINSYAEQQKSLRKIYSLFSESIAAVFDRAVTPKSFISNDTINEELSEIIYEDLLDNGILKKSEIKNNISEKALQKISFSYGISSVELRTCLSAFQTENMDEGVFRKTLEKDIKLPNQKDFWKLLIQQNILSREVKCIQVDGNKLGKVDPSLLRLLRNKIGNNELEQETFNGNDANEIILNRSKPGASETDYIIFEKGPFQQLIANEQKYKFLKKIGVFVSNRKALIDLSQVASTSFPRFDSITFKDFSRENIASHDAKKILEVLVKHKVLRKDKSRYGVYRLAIPYDEIHLIHFSAYQVYRNAIIGLLSLCFTYRRAIEKIDEQIKAKREETKNIAIYPRLLVKPHDELIYELMAQNIIRPVRFSMEIKDVENLVKCIYSRRITKFDFKSMLSQSKLIPEEKNTDELFNDLIEKGWLQIVDEEESTVSVTDPLYMSLMAIDSVFDPHRQYLINKSEERQDLSRYTDIEETLKTILDNRLELVTGDKIQQIINILQESRSPLKVSKVPDSSLKLLTECNGLDGCRHIEEINRFALNGLDHILIIKHNNWSLQVFINSAMVMVIGVVQIIVGIAIEELSLAVGIAASFVSEGISDIIFAMNMMRSRHFSWQNYSQYKAQRLMSAIITGGILTAFIPYLRNALRFGSRVAEPSSDIGRRIIGTTSSRMIIGTAGARTCAMAARNEILSNTINGTVFGLANGEVDHVVRNYFQAICDGIGSAVLSEIKRVVRERNVPGFLENAYQMLGNKEAIKLVSDLSESFFNEQSLTEKYLPIASRTARSVTQGIENAVKQMSRDKRIRIHNTSLVEMIRSVLALIPRVEELVDVESIRRITSSLLNNLERRLTYVSHNDQSETNNPIRRNQIADRENFKKKSADEWNSLLDDTVGRIIEQYIRRPILNEGVVCLTDYCERMIRNGCRSNNIGRSNDRYEQLRLQYEERQLFEDAPAPNSLDEVEGYTVKRYHNNLNMLITKTSNYKLLAALVRENVPMYVNCLDACAEVILKISGMRRITIVVGKKSGVKKRLSFSIEGAGLEENHVIEIELIDNRFQLHGSDNFERNRQHAREMKNNCLYETVSEQVNLSMTPQEFRTEVANCIENDPEVQYRIEQGWRSSSTFPSYSLIKIMSVEKPSCSNAIHDAAEVQLLQPSRSTNSKSRIPPHKRQPRNNRSSSVERAFPPQRQQPVEQFSPYI